jgi:hypothetical protein|tara:strand:- start:795 stop:1250 length:456 start_codon:yes stop_codon:yes gene_type:complete
MEKNMSDTQDHILPNGCTFLASTAGQYGTWAKATDPITAIRNAFKHDGGTKRPIYVVYGKSDDLNVSDYGGYNWQADNPPTPIGMFTVTKSTIRPVKKGDFNKDHEDCLEWMKSNLKDITMWSKEHEDNHMGPDDRQQEAIDKMHSDKEER